MVEMIRCYECDEPTPKEALVFNETCDCIVPGDCTHGVCPDCIDEIMDDEEYDDEDWLDPDRDDLEGDPEDDARQDKDEQR